MLDIFNTDTTAQGTVATSPIVAATLGVVAANKPPDFAWQNNPSYSTATSGFWTTEPNVILKVTPNASWIKVGTTAGNVANSIIPTLPAEDPFFINVDDYPIGNPPDPIIRSGTITLEYAGSRVTGLTTVTITVEQQREP